VSYILIVEDEEIIADGLSRFLIREGFETVIVAHADGVLPAIRERLPALIVLDRMLPGGDGVVLCSQIREMINVPIILLTARISEKDRIDGLKAGADDYVCKPFSAVELVLRIKTILKRYTPEPTAGSTLLLDEHTQSASFEGRDIALTKIEYSMLAMFHANPNRIYPRDSIMQYIYDDNRVVSDRTVDSHISKLRRKLKQLSPDFEMLKGVYGSGYKFQLKE